MDSQKRIVAIQGIPGAYHEMAARAYFGEKNLNILPCLTFPEVFASMEEDPSVFGIIAIENTLAGSLLPNYNLLRESNFSIIGEYKLRVQHQLAVVPGQKLEEIKEVYSHPMAIMQCQEFFKNHPHIKLIESKDTAASAQRISSQKAMGQGAICSELAANTYGLEILAKGIETNQRNFTRFLIISDDRNKDFPAWPTPKDINKSSMVFSLPHEEGSLSKILTILAFYNINLTKIQSLPIIGREWEYLFYIDLTFSEYYRYKQALDAIRPLTNKMKILGEYKEGGQSHVYFNGAGIISEIETES